MQSLTMVYYRYKLLVSGLMLLIWPLFTYSTNDSRQQNNLNLNAHSNITLYKNAEYALQQNRKKDFEQSLTKLKDYPLVEYLRRDWLIQKLTRHPISERTTHKIDAFLKRNHNQVVSRKLRYVWLNYLSDTNQHRLFETYYQPQISAKLKCRHLWLQLTNQHSMRDLSAKIEKVWVTSKSLPKQCDPLISKWRAKGELTAALVWQRMLLAAENKRFQLLRYLNRMLPKTNQASGHWLEKVVRRPSRIKENWPKNIDPVWLKDIILIGLKKLAWQQPESAIAVWKNHYSTLNLDGTETKGLKRAIGLSLAISESAQAKAWLQSLRPLNDPSVKQWLLSTNLTEQNWQFVQNFTQEEYIKSTLQDKWSFWNAVSAEMTGNLKEPNPNLEVLAGKRSYYGFLAAHKLNKAPSLNHIEKVISKEKINQLSHRPAAMRALELLRLGRYAEARSEWNQLLKTLNQNEYVVAAHLAYHWDWNHQSILAFSKSRELNDIKKRFPLFEKDQYSKTADFHRVPTSWAYAITRQESAFKKDATSSVGAQGLMQLRPSTARRVARKQFRHTTVAKLSSRDIARKRLLHRPHLNIELGIAHLKEMLDYYDGNPILATAAYNAGSNRVNEWLKDNEISNSLMWIEQIPYKETRDYVKNVLTYQTIYAELLKTDKSFISNINNMNIPIHNRSSSQLNAR